MLLLVILSAVFSYVMEAGMCRAYYDGEFPRARDPINDRKFALTVVLWLVPLSIIGILIAYFSFKRAKHGWTNPFAGE